MILTLLTNNANAPMDTGMISRISPAILVTILAKPVQIPQDALVVKPTAPSIESRMELFAIANSDISKQL